MISDLLLNFVFGVAGAFLNLISVLIPPVPGWIADGLAQGDWLFDWVYQFQTWLPVSVALSCVGWVIACHVLAMLMKLTRVVVSYATFGGGGDVGMIGFLVVVAFILWRVLRRRAKRALVAGLDRPAVWREPAAGRVGSNRKAVL